MQQRDERAAAGQPDGGLSRGVAAADHARRAGPAELRLRRPGCVEHADPLVVGEPLDGESPVLRAGCQQHGARRDLVVVLQTDDVSLAARFERERAVGRRRPRTELPRLGDGAAGQLRAADPGREAEVVLDPAGGARLAAEGGALDDERLEALRRAVHRSREARGAGADDHEVDLLARGELEPDPERARDLAGRRAAQLLAAGQTHERQALVAQSGDQGGRVRVAGLLGVAPGIRQAVAAGELDHRRRRRRTSAGRSPRCRFLAPAGAPRAWP